MNHRTRYTPSDTSLGNPILSSVPYQTTNKPNDQTTDF